MAVIGVKVVVEVEMRRKKNKRKRSPRGGNARCACVWAIMVGYWE